MKYKDTNYIFTENKRKEKKYLKSKIVCNDK